MRTTSFLVLSFLLALGCDDNGGTDAGGGGTDAGAMSDGGGGGTDAGDMDAGGGDDDAGGGDVDAGDTDAGDVDGGGGDTDAGTDAGGGGACPPDLDPQDDGSGVSGGVGLPDIVLSEVAPGMFIELFNTTDADIDLSAGSFQLCSPFTYVALADHAGTVTVPAGGYATIPWPSSFSDTAAQGEVILYANATFSNGGSILDFVCWGPMRTGSSRRVLAITSGKWMSGCAEALTMGSITRNMSTEGRNASHYTVTNAPTMDDCTP